MCFIKMYENFKICNILKRMKYYLKDFVKATQNYYLKSI